MTGRLDTARAASVIAAARALDAPCDGRAAAQADAWQADAEVVRLEAEDFHAVVRCARTARDAAEQAERIGLEAFLALQEARREAQADYDEVLATAEIWSAPTGQEPARGQAAPKFGFSGPGPQTVARIRVVSRNL